MKSTITDITKVWCAFIGALSLSAIQAMVSITAMLIAIAYTLWKWRKQMKDFDDE
jgi:hypothetical protein